MKKFNYTLLALLTCLTTATVVFPLDASAATTPMPPMPPMTPMPIPGLGGLCAAYIASAGENISGKIINASGCDIGIYIAVNGVTVTGTNVSGANDEGILVQDASNVVIQGNTIVGNGVSTNFSWWNPPHTQDSAEIKAIILAGTTNCTIQGNLVQGNLHGGIAVLDDGPNHVYSPPSATNHPLLSGTGNVIQANIVQDNQGDCGIVVSAKNAGAGVDSNSVLGNTVNGFNPAAGDFIPGVGGIVVATGYVGAATVTNTVIGNNTVTGGFLAGIALHCANFFGPGSISGTQITGNVLSNNGMGEYSGNTTGIELFAQNVPGPAAVITKTQVLNDSISNDVFGVFRGGDTATNMGPLQTNKVTIPFSPYVIWGGDIYLYDPVFSPSNGQMIAAWHKAGTVWDWTAMYWK